MRLKCQNHSTPHQKWFQWIFRLENIFSTKKVHCLKCSLPASEPGTGQIRSALAAILTGRFAGGIRRTFALLTLFVVRGIPGADTAMSIRRHGHARHSRLATLSVTQTDHYNGSRLIDLIDRSVEFIVSRKMTACWLRTLLILLLLLNN